MKKEITLLLKKALKKLNVKFSVEEIFIDLEIPRDVSNGDYVYPCFKLGEILKLDSHLCALQLRAKLGSFSPIIFDDISVQDEYICFYVDRKKSVQRLFWQVLNKREKFGELKNGKNFFGFRKKIGILKFNSFSESYSLNNFYLDSVSNSLDLLLKKNFYKTYLFDVFDDFDLELIKILVSYEVYGSDVELEKHILEHFLECRKKLKEDKRTLILINEFITRLCEKENSAVLLLKIFKDAYFKSINSIKKQFEISISSFESYLKILDYSQKYNSLLEKNLIKYKGFRGILLKDKKFCPLISPQGFYLPEFFLLFYLIFYARKYNFNKIYLIINNSSFGLLSKVLDVAEVLGFSIKDKFIFINCREISAKTLKKEFLEMNFEQIFSLVSLGFDRLKDFGILNKRIVKSKDFVLDSLKYEIFKFNFEKEDFSLNLNDCFKKGNNFLGVFSSYFYATKLLDKAKLISKDFEIEEIDDLSWKLLRLLSSFPSFINKSLNKKDFTILSNYCFNIVSSFNSFYSRKKDSFKENPNFYFGIVEIYRQVLRNALRLLSIDLAKLN